MCFFGALMPSPDESRQSDLIYVCSNPAGTTHPHEIMLKCIVPEINDSGGGSMNGR